MDEESFADALREVLAETDGASEALSQTTIRRIDSFEDVGMLTNNAGLVVTLNDGSEYQLTVVQSRMARG